MCRWFAYISDEEAALLDDVLIRPAHSIAKQVHSSYLPFLFHHTKSKKDDQVLRTFIKSHNSFVNVDGTGVCFYTSAQSDYGETDGLRPQLYKAIQPPLNDTNFTSLCSHNASTVIFAHIRMATSIVTPVNSHPFIFGRHSFMHNGMISTFGTSPTLRRKMLSAMSAKACANVLGSTDSEHLAGLYFTYLGDDWEKAYPLAEMKAALEKSIQVVIDFQKEELGIGAKVEPSDLNLCTTDGIKLLAFRYRNSSDELELPASLYISTTAGPTLNRKYEGHPDQTHPTSAIEPQIGSDQAAYATASPSVIADAHRTKNLKGTKTKSTHGKHVIVASEPTTFNQDEWTLVGQNEAVLVHEDMQVTHEPVHVTF